MREKPVLFSSSMVRAILDGRKTQTRRVYKPRNPEPWELPPGEGYKDDGTPWPMYQDSYGDFHPIRCPYGAPGDRLWVRETFRPWFDDDEFDVVQYRADGSVRKPEGLNEAQGYHFHDECQRATGESPWRPSIFMPRWASRLTLEVEAVRVERLQEISDDDIQAEGVVLERGPRGEYLSAFDRSVHETRRDLWRAGWDALNRARGFGWAENPYVWVVMFKRVEAARG